MDLESVYSELDKGRTIRLRPLEDHLIVRPIERKSSLRTSGAMPLCRYTAMQFFRHSRPCNAHANAMFNTNPVYKKYIKTFRKLRN